MSQAMFPTMWAPRISPYSGSPTIFTSPAIVVDDRRPGPAELELAQLDLAASLLRLLLGHAHTGHLGVSEGRAGDEVDVYRLGLMSRRRLHSHHALLLGLVSEGRATNEIADREDSVG